MAITPSSIIRLCNVPFDSTYKNQIYFGSRDEQTNYFSNRVVKTFSDYSYIRRGEQSGVRVDMHIDELAICNYIMYQNKNYTNKWFYAFVTELVYKNDNCTEIYFETDCYQTWRFEISILDSYVLREHSETDIMGENLLPENFSFRDYRLQDISTRLFDGELSEWGYLVGTTEQLGADGSRGKQMSGIYQGLYFYYFHNGNTMNEFLDAVEGEGGDCVQFIACIPKFCVSANTIGHKESEWGVGQGWIYTSANPAKVEMTTTAPPYGTVVDGYKPKNNKCYTQQFYSLLVSNNAGTVNEYAFEYFVDRIIGFEMLGDVSANPTVTLVPLDYNGVEINFEESISLAGFPQCAFNSDTFKLWLSRNQFAIGVQAAQNVAAIAGGSPVDKVSGAVGIANQIADIAAHSKDPNRLHPGNTRNNLLTAAGKNKFTVYLKHLRYDHMRMVDDYFTMYGYRTERVKVPQMSARPYYNYVQTADVNITGAIPNKDMDVIKNMFNSGVTLWKPNATVGNYAVNNGV